MANRNYFENCKNKGVYASSQYIIGLQGEIIRCVPEDEISYHAGNYTVNCNSIGIENCHPGWDGKFNDATYNSLVELCSDICKRYGLNPSTAIKRHYDVTGKECPKYYVQNRSEWEKLKSDVAKKMGNTNQIQTTNNKEVEKFEMAKTYKNGSTVENVFADSGLKNKIGSLDKYETCECLGMTDGRYIVRYKINGGNTHKVGFVAYSGGVK